MDRNVAVMWLLSSFTGEQLKIKLMLLGMLIWPIAATQWFYWVGTSAGGNNDD
jgi:apolipoprotein N-acyltransferase